MGEHDEHIAFEMGYNKGFKDGIKGSIPKADYENRLKADKVAMLTELKNELIDISWNIDMYDSDLDFDCCYLNDIEKVINQKIDSLKETKDGNNTK